MKKIAAVLIVLFLCSAVFTPVYADDGGNDLLPFAPTGNTKEPEATATTSAQQSSTPLPQQENTPEPQKSTKPTSKPGNTQSAPTVTPSANGEITMPEEFIGANLPFAPTGPTQVPAAESTEAAALATVSPAPTATFPPIEVAAVKERQDMGPVWILVGAMGVVIIILQIILMRMHKKK